MKHIIGEVFCARKLSRHRDITLDELEIWPSVLRIAPKNEPEVLLGDADHGEFFCTRKFPRPRYKTLDELGI